MCPNDWAHTPQPPGPHNTATKATHHTHRSPHTTTPGPHTQHWGHTPQHWGHTAQHQSHIDHSHKSHTTTPGPTGPEPESHGPRRHCGEKSAHGRRGIPESPRVEKTLHVSGDPALPTMCKYLKPSFLTHRGLSDFPLGEQGKGSETQLPPWRAAVRGVREPDSAERLNRNRQRQEQPLTARPSGPGTGARSRGHAGTAWAGPSLREPGIQAGTDRLLSTKQGRVRPGL